MVPWHRFLERLATVPRGQPAFCREVEVIGRIGGANLIGALWPVASGRLVWEGEDAGAGAAAGVETAGRWCPAVMPSGKHVAAASSLHVS